VNLYEGRRKNKKKQVKSECTECPDFATCDSDNQCAIQCDKFLLETVVDGSEICTPSDDPTLTGAGHGVILNSKIDNNMGLILDNLFGAMVQKDNRRNSVVTKLKNQIDEIHDFIFNKIEDYQASTLEGATNGPFEKCYYEKSPEFGYSHTAFDEWKANYQEEIDSITGIQRSHS